MRQPGIDGRRLAGVGGCVAQELALGGDRQESRRHRNPKRKGKGKMPARRGRDGVLMV